MHETMNIKLNNSLIDHPNNMIAIFTKPKRY